MILQLWKRIAVGAAASLCILTTLSYKAQAAGNPPATISETYVVMDAETGQVLFGKGADKKMPPASITKILTAALALSKHSMDEKYVIPEEAMNFDRDSTHIALQAGEEVSVEQLVYTTLVESANDAANALGTLTGKTLDGFAEMMNEKAQELGAVNSHFVNPSGLPDPNHYTTARDMALITRWALTVPNFREPFGAIEYDMPPTNKQPEPRHVETHHTMYVTSAFTYEGATGGKLGWTTEAQHTLVTVAHRNGMELICVAMRSPSKWDKFKDTVALYDYAFQNYERTTLPVSAFSLPARIPVMDGDQEVSAIMPVLPTKVPIDLPRGSDARSLTIRHNLPQQFSLGEEPRLEAEVYDGETFLFSIPIDYTEKAVTTGADLAEDAKKDRAKKEIPSFVWWTAGVILLAILIFARYVAVQRRKALRRAQRRRRMEALRQDAIHLTSAYQELPRLRDRLG